VLQKKKAKSHGRNFGKSNSSQKTACNIACTKMLLMTKLLTTIFLITAFLLSCTTNDRQVKSELPEDTSSVIPKLKDKDAISTVGYFKIDKDSITVLPFEISITLSPKAKDKIIDSKETIIVNVSLTGSPKDKKLIAEDGEFYVASSEKEITYGQLAKFDNI
jgi:preprotein translocase subunit SecG